MITGRIQNQTLRISQDSLVAGTINYLSAQFEFSDEWNGLIKWAHFSKMGENYDVRLSNDGITAGDNLNLSAGTWAIYIHGDLLENDTVTQRITTDVKTIVVKSTGILDGEPLPISPPSVGEQILAIAQSVRDDADAGLFNGSAGPQGLQGEMGPSGYTPIKGIDYFDGVKGDKGEPGPQGEAGTDASVTAQNITVALGYTPAKPEGAYELIETITLTENVASIVYTQEPDGTPYNFCALMVLLNTSASVLGTSAATIRYYLNDTTYLASYLSGAITSAARYAYQEAWLNRGFWKGEFCAPQTERTYAPNISMLPLNTKVYDSTAYPSIKKINIFSNTGTIPMPVGSKITIYGVRA